MNSDIVTVKRIIERMREHVIVESAFKRGSSFQMLFPQFAEKRAKESTASHDACPPERSSSFWLWRMKA